MNKKKFLQAAGRAICENTQFRGLFLEKLHSLSDEEIETIVNSPIIEPQKVWASWPKNGETMTFPKNMEFLIDVCETVANEKIEGDLVETGIWRGGCAILMKLSCDVLEHRNSRKIYACDSFEGCPPPGILSEKDLTIPSSVAQHNWNHALKQSIDDVRENFARYGLVENVNLVKGWFCHTMPSLQKDIEKIAVLRLDGDCYSSTIDVLNSLYEKVSPGGFVILDDLDLECCVMATTDFRKEKNITTPIEYLPGDWRENGGVGYWRIQN